MTGLEASSAEGIGAELKGASAAGRRFAQIVSADYLGRPALQTAFRLGTRTGLELVFAYVLLLGVTAWLCQWTPDYLAGRSLWHFWLSRMLIPMVALGALAAWARIVPASLLLSSLLLLAGAISAIKREALGEPVQITDFLLASQGTSLLGYVSWDKWLMGATLVPAVILYAANIRLRLWSVPLFAVCFALLCSYRLESVVKLIHDYGAPFGLENLPFNQSESERMSGIATHLYFSTAGIRLGHYSNQEMESAVAGLDTANPLPARSGPKPDVYVVLGEAWWRDPADVKSPLDALLRAGFIEGTAVSPVYGGTTANAEFEVLTGVPMHSFSTGIIPYQHYFHYFTQPVTLPRLLSRRGYAAHAYHNHHGQFWLRDKIYPRFGFDSFDSAERMRVTMQPNGWERDDALYAKALDEQPGRGPQLQFLVTVATHGPYMGDRVHEDSASQGVKDYRERLAGAVNGLLAFERQLRQRKRPFVLIVFGDHLPGLRLHQIDIGFVPETDPRFHQVPILFSGSEPGLAGLRDLLRGRPLYCIGPVLTQWLRLGVDDRYFRHVTKLCRQRPQPDFVPSEAVIQYQLFR